MRSLREWPFIAHPPMLRATAQIACRARDAEALEILLNTTASPPELALYQAWLLEFQSQPERVLALLESLESIEDAVTPYETGLRLRLWGSCLSLLGRPVPVWQPYFQAARGHLHGIALGVCLLTEAGHLYAAGCKAEAWRIWAEALPRVREDVYYSAWGRYNLGIARLREGDLIGAEGHFIELERLSTRQAAASLRTAAHIGFGAVRRRLGELERAHGSYREAVRLSKQKVGDAQDFETAFWGLGFVTRLMGRPDEALGYFIEAEAHRGFTWLRPDQAACTLQMGDLKRTRILLEAPPPSNLRSHNLHHLLKAELARNIGRIEEIMLELRKIDFSQGSLQEEVSSFPELFGLAAQQGFPALKGIAPAPLQVGVRAEGALRLTVGGRAVPLKATGLPAQILVYLLEKGGEVDWREIADAIYRHEFRSADKTRQALWVHVKILRKVLGWNSSVSSEQGTLRLDPLATWTYDIAQLRKQRIQPQAFLKGVDQEWVLERRRELGLDD